jgi:hypothetical protein
MPIDSREHSRWTIQSTAYWLPPVGRGNGLGARAWAPIADLADCHADAMLTACARERIAAFAAARDGGRPRSGPRIRRVWVDSEHFGAAEDVLRRVVGQGQHGSAW